jgi:serine/threonine-protein kinase RsbW
LSSASELRLRCPAQSHYVASVRHALAAFLQALQVDRDFLEDVTTAAGEALANVVEHAYARRRNERACYVELRAKVLRGGKLSVDVSDDGAFVERTPLPGRGFGLRIIRAVAGKLTIDTTQQGTCVRMTFDGVARARPKKRER